MVQRVMQQKVENKRDGARRQEIAVDLLQRFDPSALSPLTRDRALHQFLQRALDLTVASVM